MGSYVCKKCGIDRDSPYIIDNCYRTHCRVHNFTSNDGWQTFFCKDCSTDNNKKNCRHTFTFKFCCFK